MTYDHRLSPDDDAQEALRERADDDFDCFLMGLSKRIREALNTEETRAAYVEARMKEIEADDEDARTEKRLSARESV